MNRLTRRNKDGIAYYPHCYEWPCGGSKCTPTSCDFDDKACERLASYEDTGMEPEEIAALKRELDAAATAQNAKCPAYFTPEMDGLSQSWTLGGAVFCNPPYGREIGRWVKKAYEEAQKGVRVVLLIPARTDTNYFHDYIYGKAEIRFIRGRLRFTDDNGSAADPAPFPSILVIYNGRARRKDDEQHM